MPKMQLRTACIVAVVLVFGPSLMAQSSNRSARTAVCSSGTLSGDYGILIEGTILGPDLSLRTVSMTRFDGKGNATSVDHVVLNGIPPEQRVPPEQEWRPGIWTYTVNPNCTGTAMVITDPASPPINLHFVVVKHGTEIRGVVDGSAIVLTGSRVE